MVDVDRVQEGVGERPCLIQVPAQIDGADGGCEVGECPCQPQPVGVPRDGLQGEGVLDGSLDRVSLQYP